MSDAEIDRLEHVLGIVLRVGSLTSTAILAVGLLLALVAPSFGPALAIIRVGLLVLLLTPVARVVASVFEYAKERDWLFALLTFVVLVIILGSLLVGTIFS
jgi:uncharacterized membrane protein